MKPIHRAVFGLGSFVILLLAPPFSEWKRANAQKTPEELELQLSSDGVKMVQLQPQKAFFAPYTVEPGDTFESISTKFYGRPDLAENLAAALGVPVVHIPLAGEVCRIGMILMNGGDVVGAVHQRGPLFSRQVKQGKVEITSPHRKWRQGTPESFGVREIITSAMPPQRALSESLFAQCGLPAGIHR